jgi:hypothetical protein
MRPLSNFLTKTKRIVLSRRFLICYSVLLVVMALCYGLSKQQSFERFISISTLGANMSTGNYYPAGNSTAILPGQKVSWYIDVYNHAGESEFLAVRVKLLNSTDPGPNDTSQTPSPADHIYEFTQLVKANSTWTIPFDWIISNMSVDVSGNRTTSSNRVTINDMIIGATKIGGLNVTSPQQNGFRMIFELWVYDRQAEKYVYQLPFGDDNSSSRNAWNQIWFNVKA